MSIKTQCTDCGKTYMFKDEAAGKKIRCKSCNNLMLVPHLEDDFDDLDEDIEIVPTQSRKSKKSKTTKRKKSAGKSIFSSTWFWVISTLGGFFIMSCICCVAIGQRYEEALKISAMKKANMDPAKEVDFGDPSSLFPVSKIPEGPAPDLSPGRSIEGTNVKYHVAHMTGFHGAYPGHGMSFRIYIPQDAKPDRTRTCVLVAPAGTTLLHGNELDDVDYHDEALPYAKAGMIAVCYSLDGPLEEGAEKSKMITAYLQFRAAMAGVVNGRNAVEFVLKKLPQVNPQRIYSAGHSSAATLSLILAAHEPRLAGAIAYAACTDTEERLQMANSPLKHILFKSVDFVKQSSPKTQAAHINCPVFLFHAEDDSNVDVLEAKAFHQQLQSLGKTTELKLVPTGDHYQSMIDQGIPAGIEWIKSKTGE